MGRKVCTFIILDISQKGIETMKHALCQFHPNASKFREDFDDFVHRYEDRGNSCGKES